MFFLDRDPSFWTNKKLFGKFLQGDFKLNDQRRSNRQSDINEDGLLAIGENKRRMRGLKVSKSISQLLSTIEENCVKEKRPVLKKKKKIRSKTAF